MSCIPSKIVNCPSVLHRFGWIWVRTGRSCGGASPTAGLVDGGADVERSSGEPEARKRSDEPQLLHRPSTYGHHRQLNIPETCMSQRSRRKYSRKLCVSEWCLWTNYTLAARFRSAPLAALVGCCFLARGHRGLANSVRLIRQLGGRGAPETDSDIFSSNRQLAPHSSTTQINGHPATGVSCDSNVPSQPHLMALHYWMLEPVRPRRHADRPGTGIDITFSRFRHQRARKLVVLDCPFVCLLDRFSPHNLQPSPFLPVSASKLGTGAASRAQPCQAWHGPSIRRFLAALRPLPRGRLSLCWCGIWPVTRVDPNGACQGASDGCASSVTMHIRLMSAQLPKTPGDLACPVCSLSIPSVC